MVIVASIILSCVSALVTTLPPITWFFDPMFEIAYPIMGAWAVTWMGFNLYALLMALIPFRRGERWAWYALWTLPLFWLFQFVFFPNLIGNVVLAALSVIGLALSARRFFSGAEEQSSRVE
jgi:uncharacterized membrane protein YozB (DUF420 family)